jgi:DNA polymerase-3 subunit alpha
VLYALGAIRNVGLAAMEHVVEIRKTGGPFVDLYDFVERVDPKCVNKRAIENLARAGAFDSLGVDRAMAFSAADVLVSYGQSLFADRAGGQQGLFGEAVGRPRMPKVEPWSAPDQLDEELAAVGFYLTGHPLEDMIPMLRRKRVVLLTEAVPMAEAGMEAFKMAGVVRRRQERASQSGDKFAFVSMSDPSGEYEVLFPPESLRACREVLEPGKSVILRVRAKAKDGEVRFFGDGAEPLDKALEGVAAGLRVHLAPDADLELLKKRLGVQTDRGGEIFLIAPLSTGPEVELKLPGRFTLDAALRGALKNAPGVRLLEDV